MKPLVAVTAITRPLDLDFPRRLAHATVDRRFGELIVKAGGIPVTVAPGVTPEDLIDRIDALVLNGGQDVAPALYGAEPHAQIGPTDAERDRFELALVRLARDRGKPVLGVCRGMHVVNVAYGGTLIQHLPEVTDRPHNVRDRFDQPVHHVHVEPGSALARALGTDSLEVNSVHHQSVDRLGEGLTASARSDDGVTEAIEADGGRTLAIQWHPEFLAPEYDPLHVGIFGALIDSAG